MKIRIENEVDHDEILTGYFFIEDSGIDLLCREEPFWRRLLNIFR